MREVLALILVGCHPSPSPSPAVPVPAPVIPTPTPTPPPVVAEVSERLRITEPTLFRITPANQVERVAEHAVLHTGDRIRIELVANRVANLYLLQRHDNGATEVIVPAPDEGLAKTLANALTTIPSSTAQYEIALDDVTGNDTLYVVVAASPLDIVMQVDPDKPKAPPPKPRVLVKKPVTTTTAVGGPAPSPLVGRSNGYTPKGVVRVPKHDEKFQLTVEAPDRDDVIVRAIHFRHE